jgi:hypothetical protein
MCRVSKAALALGGMMGVLAAGGRAGADPSSLPPPLIYNYGEIETARSAAMGGALRALGNGATGMFLNPATLAETRVYHVEALANFIPEAARQVYGGAIVDSVTGKFAGGVSLEGGFMDPSGIDRSFIDARLDLAYPVSDRLFLGLEGRYIQVTQAGLGPLGASVVSGGLIDATTGARQAFVNTATFDAGIAMQIAEGLFLGLVGQNLTNPNNGLQPTIAGGGIGYGTDNLSIEGDALADFTSWGKATARLMAGGEYLVANHVPVRLGYRFDQGANLHYLSGGLGYLGQEFSVDASVRRSLSSSGSTDLVFSLAYFLESTGITRAPAGESE